MLATLFGIVLLLLTASGVFGEIQSSLNAFWRIEQESLADQRAQTFLLGAEFTKVYARTFGSLRRHPQECAALAPDTKPADARAGT